MPDKQRVLFLCTGNSARSQMAEGILREPTQEDRATKPKKRLLFVCVENSNRSQMAEAFARIHGGADVEVYSAGSRPSGQINPRAIDSMREVGYDLKQQRSKSLSEIPDVEYDFVATMGCGDECPFARAKVRSDWDIPDPKNLPINEYRAVRNLIETKVTALLADLRS